MLGFSQEHQIFTKKATAEWQNIPISKKRYEFSLLTEEVDWEGVPRPETSPEYEDEVQMGSSYGDELQKDEQIRQGEEQKKYIEREIVETIKGDLDRRFTMNYGDEYFVEVKWTGTPVWQGLEGTGGMNFDEKFRKWNNGVIQGGIEISLFVRIPADEELELEYIDYFDEVDQMSIKGFK